MFCLTVAEKNYDKIFEKIKKGSQYTDFFELRIDYLEKPEFSKVREILKLPYKFLFTFRSKKEGGAKRVSEKTQLEWILWALEEKFYLVDVEWRLFKKFSNVFLNKSLNRILISYHNFKNVPADRYLRKLLKGMQKYGIKKAKIVCKCNNFKEVFRLLGLIIDAKELGIDLISFGMGEDRVIKLSRILCLIIGSPFTYVCFPGKKGVAPGQIDILKAKNVLTSFNQV